MVATVVDVRPWKKIFGIFPRLPVCFPSVYQSIRLSAHPQSLNIKIMVNASQSKTVVAVLVERQHAAPLFDS